jgi:uncharacterized protein (TIGR03083 family)
MSTMLTLHEYEDAIRAAGRLLITASARAGFDAPVPTCPEWLVRDLLIHQGIIHRWATELAAGRTSLADEPLAEEDVASSVADPILADWLETGLNTLIATLESMAPDSDVPTFLANAPRPREFWTRRQAHETTIHAVDALAAQLGRFPTANEATSALGLTPALAADGIDEILRGFFSRGHSSRLFEGQAVTFDLAPTDAAHHWSVHVDQHGLRVASPSTASPKADAVFSGSAAQLYLGLWNRGDEITVGGEPGLLTRWRERQHVTWA